MVNDLLRARGLAPITPDVGPAVAAATQTAQTNGAEPAGPAPQPMATGDPIETEPPRDLGPEDLSLARDPGLALGSDYESLAEVLAEVWTTNPQVGQALSKAEAAGYEIASARTGYFPFLNVESRQASNDASATTVSLIQPLWDGGLTGAQVDEARAQRRLTLAELNQTRLDLGLTTAQAYFNVALAQEQAAIWSRYRAALKRLLGIIQRRADEGLAAPVDVETARARLHQAAAGTAANRAQLAVNRAQLATLLARPVGLVAWPLAGAALTASETEAVTSGRLAAAHPARQRARQQVELAQARADISGAKLWPQISLQYSRLVQQSAGDFTPDSAFQLVLQYQTDAGLRGYRGLQAQRARVEAGRYGLEAAKRQVRNRVRSAAVQRGQARLQFRAQAAAAVSSLRLVESFLRQFKVGRKSWVDVLNAQREANQARLQAAVAKHAFWSANALMALQGMMWQELSPRAPAPVVIDDGRH